MPLPSTGDFTSPQMAQRIVDEALVLSEGFRDAFTQAISEIVESAELIQLLQDIQAGQFVGLTPGVLDIIDAVEIEPDEMLRIQREALAQAADITNQETGLDFRFDIINPRAAQAALNIGSYLVRYINESVRDRLREIIAEQTSGLLSVADARRMIRDRVGLLPQHAVAVQNYEAGLLASGMDPTRVQTLAARYSERLLRYRAEMISRTEVARATSVGQQEYWLQARDAGRLPPNTMRIWIVNIDELTCDICRPMQDSDPIGLEDYWTTVEGDTVYYPTQSHPNCRCTTGLVFPDLMNKVDPTGYERWLMTRPVQKHANHDQKSHGNWARQGQLPGIDWDGFKISDIERLKRSIGLRPGQEIWQHPVMREAFWRGEVPDDEWEAQYQVIEYIEGEWAKFGPARQIRDAAEKLLGLEEPERGDPTLDPYQESGLDVIWGGGEARVSDEEARVMALWFLEQSAQVEGKFYRGTDASVERMGLSEGDEFDVGLLSFAGYPQTAARFGTETIFVVENPIGYQGERLDMDVRYTAADADEFYNVVRTHAERDELQDMYGEDIFVVGEAVSEDAHPDVFYGGFEDRSEGLDTEFLLTGSYRIASIERVNPASGLRVSDMEPYATDKGEVLGVVDVVTLQPIDRDGDGIILEGTDEERFVGKAEKSRRPAWLRLFELSLGEMALASGAVEKHADHDQKSHGNWARTGSATPKEMRERFDGRLPMLDGYRNNSGLASATEYGTGSASFYFGSLPTVDSYSGRLILGKNSTAQQEWEDGYLDDKRGTYVDGMEGPVDKSGWWTNIGAWHQRMLSAAILGLEVPEAISYELVSGWSPLTTELVVNGELTGETVDAYMDAEWGEGNYTSANRDEEIEAAEWFVADQLQRSWKALAAAGHNPPIDYKLYRVVQNLNPDSELMNLKPGDTYHAPLGSYSAYTYMANDFLNRGANDERPEVVITVKPGARGATYDGIGRGEFSGGGLPDEIGGPLEAVIAGKFQVTEVRVATDGIRHIEVAQVEYPDVKTRYEEKLTFFTASDTQSEQSRQEIKNNLPRDADGDGIIFEGTPRERFTPLVAPVEKAEGRPRVPAWFFDDFAPAERHSDDALSKHANHDQKSHGNWARSGPYAAQLASVSENDLDPANLRPAAAEFLRKKWIHYTDQAVGRTIGAAMMGLPNYPSEGDEAVESDLYYREGALDAIYRGELTPLLISDMKSVEDGGGGLTNPQDVALMMKDAVESDPTTGENYRGMVVNDATNYRRANPILNLIEGETFSMPPSSFAPSLEVAKRFQVGGMFEPSERMTTAEDLSVFGFSWANVMFVLEPGAKVSVSGATLGDAENLADDRTSLPFEVVANGEFEVLSKDFRYNDDLGVNEYTIRVRQLSTFDPFENEYVDVVDRTPDWMRED